MEQLLEEYELMDIPINQADKYFDYIGVYPDDLNSYEGEYLEDSESMADQGLVERFPSLFIYENNNVVYSPGQSYQS